MKTFRKSTPRSTIKWFNSYPCISKHIEGLQFENVIETVRTMTVMIILTKKTLQEDIIRKVANAYNMTMKIP